MIYLDQYMIFIFFAFLYFVNFQQETYVNFIVKKSLNELHVQSFEKYFLTFNFLNKGVVMSCKFPQALDQWNLFSGRLKLREFMVTEDSRVYSRVFISFYRSKENC